MRATPNYVPGTRPPDPPCRRDSDGQLVRMVLDEHERTRQHAVDALHNEPRSSWWIRRQDGKGYQAPSFRTVLALVHYDPDEERIRRMAARP